MNAKITLSLIALAALVFNFTNVYSQVPVKQWDARFAGGAEDKLYDVHQTSDGGYILGGATESDISGEKTQPSRGEDDYWMVKVDANGAKQWDARFGGDEKDYGRAVEQTSDGGYILGGYSSSGINGDRTQSNQGVSDYWMVKTDANGVKQWDKRFGGDDVDFLRDIEQTSDGGYILGGQTQSGMGGDKSQPSQGGKDFWVVKTDANGNKQWDKRFGGSSEEEFRTVQQTNDGGYLIGGKSESNASGDKSQDSRGLTDFWIIKIDANGNKEWDATYGGTKGDDMYTFQQTADQGYILGGLSHSNITGDKTNLTKGGADYWMIKIDQNGVKEWDVDFGGTEIEYLYSVQQLPDGDYLLGGQSNSTNSGDRTQPTWGGYDYWMIRTDANGIKKWDVRFGGSKDDYFYWAEPTSDNNIIIGGYSDSGISGDRTQDSLGDYDYWILKATYGVAGTITTGTVSGEPFCPEEVVNVPFTSSGTFNSGNIYTAQLSDDDGSFTSPTAIGTLGSTANAGTIISTIPSDPNGSKTYRIRVVSSNPPVTGTDNGKNLKLTACKKVSDLAVSGITSTSATVNWSAADCAAKYKVQYRKVGDTKWKSKFSTTNSYAITGLTANSQYEYRVKTYCSESGSAASAYTSVKTFSTTLRLGSASAEQSMDISPNPFTSTSIISFSLEQESHVMIELYDLAGRKLQTLLDENATEGNHEISFDRKQLSAGVYFLRLKMNNEVMTIKAVIE